MILNDNVSTYFILERRMQLADDSLLNSSIYFFSDEVLMYNAVSANLIVAHVHALYFFSMLLSYKLYRLNIELIYDTNEQPCCLLHTWSTGIFTV